AAGSGASTDSTAPIGSGTAPGSGAPTGPGATGRDTTTAGRADPPGGGA
ncbi:MAG: hypothetical protein K0S88_650, partial [Actinomycetia bacterium]|nr:hypothetical protein [Actinomycetes bacterium]